MANEEHLSLIRQGVEVWNQWRKDNPEAYPDLNQADLSGADLNEVNLSFAGLDLVNFKGATRRKANLRNAIRLHDKLLIVLSEESVKSDWVEFEVEAALERGGNALFPVRIDDAVMESEKAWARQIKRTLHIGDFTNWKDHDAYQEDFERLLRDLKAAKETVEDEEVQE